MNVHVTRALDGFSRRRFTVAEVLRMQEAGIFAPEERFELIEGEIVPVQAKRHSHERIKLALTRALSRYLPDHLQLGVETSCFLSEITFVEPDLSVFPMAIPTDQVRAGDLILAIEVGASSLSLDRGPKAKVYAGYGLRELWVIDAATGLTYVHTDPTALGYGRFVEKRPEEILETPVLPGFGFRVADVP
jgi:Uma2 family endonuclease